MDADEKIAQASEVKDRADEERKASESEEESSYYDTEEESEQEEGQTGLEPEEPKTQEIFDDVVDVTGNMSQEKRAEIEAQKIFKAAHKCAKTE